jgi:hypothetical protein
MSFTWSLTVLSLVNAAATFFSCSVSCNYLAAALACSTAFSDAERNAFRSASKPAGASSAFFIKSEFLALWIVAQLNNAVREALGHHRPFTRRLRRQLLELRNLLFLE